jgi:nucleotide-binding universal stress UspA family protein
MGTNDSPRPLHVLLATDLSAASTPHVTYGVQLAKQLGSRLTLFHAAIRPSVPDSFSATVDLEGKRRELQNLAATLPVDRHAQVEFEVATNARQAILAAAERTQADLLVVPSHGRSGLQRALLGSTAEEVVRHSTRPVLLVTDRMLPSPPANRDSNRFIVVPVDLAGETHAAQLPAAELARRLGLPLLLMTVLPTSEGPPMGGGAPVAPTRTDPQQRVNHALRDLRQLATKIGGGLHIEVFASIADDPAAEIVAKAKAPDAAMLVASTHARTGLLRLFRGSVAENMVRHATVPVVCVPLPHG